jgi:hypothetical protein
LLLRSPRPACWYDLALATPNGSNKQLADGYYPWAQDAFGTLSRGRPGIHVEGGPYPCGTNSGSFEVRDIRRVHGVITRLRVVFTRYCGSYGCRFRSPCGVLSGMRMAVRMLPADVGSPWLRETVL